MLLVMAAGWDAPRVSLGLGLRTQWLDTPVPSLLAVTLKVSLGSFVHLGFQVKLWLAVPWC